MHDSHFVSEQTRIVVTEFVIYLFLLLFITKRTNKKQCVLKNASNWPNLPYCKRSKVHFSENFTFSLNEEIL